jgi:hypothetical protein
MRLNISEQIENALSQEMPIENLRQLAIKLNANGIEKNEILTAFFEHDNFLKRENRDQDASFLEDVIDMIVGHYEGRNLNFK